MAASGQTFAGNLTMTPFSTSYSGFNGFAVDPTTGKYYSHTGYGYGSTFGYSQNLSEYDTLAALQGGTPSSTTTLSGYGPWGTYMAVSNGEVYARTNTDFNAWPTGTDSARWNAATGSQDATLGSIPGMAGVNGSDTFNWGGFSGVNWMQDSTGLYVLGHNASGNGWQIDKMDSNLNLLSTVSFGTSTTSLGYAFMINGTLFASSNYFSNQIDWEVNATTGAVTPVNITLSGMGTLYADNAFYDPTTDKLFVHNVSDGTIYSLDGAAAAFGVQSISTPEPATLASVCLAGLITGLYRLRNRGPRD
jgi:autoaggregation protein RapA/B/C